MHFPVLKKTTNYGLLFRKSDSKSITGFSDADWGGDLTDCKSTCDYHFQIGSTSITWQSKKQSYVALSTAEAEYVALAGAPQETTWLKQLYQDLQGSNEPIVIYEDNQSAISIAMNPQFHGRVKHINIKYHFVRDQVSGNNIEVVYCQTDEMVADMLTKALGRVKHEKFREMAGVSPMPDCKSEEY